MADETNGLEDEKSLLEAEKVYIGIQKQEGKYFV